MKHYRTIILITISIITTSFTTKDVNENIHCETHVPKIVNLSIEIDVNTARVWDIITNKDYAKILGNEFDKNAFVESDWKLNSKVYFKSGSGKVISTGTITKLTEGAFIQVDYNFYGTKYVEKYAIEKTDAASKLSVYAGPYTSDFEAQKIVWKNWLSKVKELSEKQ